MWILIRESQLLFYWHCIYRYSFTKAYVFSVSLQFRENLYLYMHDIFFLFHTISIIRSHLHYLLLIFYFFEVISIYLLIPFIHIPHIVWFRCDMSKTQFYKFIERIINIQTFKAKNKRKYTIRATYKLKKNGSIMHLVIK